MTLAEAYAECRVIARREAKNFYYAFFALPRAKSNAMCAVYAFMRRADDLADDETLSIAARHERMAAWTAAWRASRNGKTDDPVFLALNDTQQRFHIPDELLEQLVRGTMLDLEAEAPGTVVCSIAGRNYQAYQTVAALHEYCYLVASVVGLVCIRIFGYTDPKAEKLAEETGIAFQRTNILRDVKEDALRGRIYLPLEILRASGVTPEHLVALAEGRESLTETDRRMMESVADDTAALYRAADRLLPLIDRDSRAALWVLVRIYFSLLQKIRRTKGDVFRERVSVPASRKLMILAQGLVKTACNRVAR